MWVLPAFHPLLKLHLWENPCLSLPARMLSYNLFLTRPLASHEIALLHFLRISPHRLRLGGWIWIDNLLIDFDNYSWKHIWGFIKSILCLSLSNAKNSLQYLYIKPQNVYQCVSTWRKCCEINWKLWTLYTAKWGFPWYKSPFIDTQKFALMPFKWTLKLCATIRVSVPCFIVI